jgi:O-acetyl-ADP-ribose deacetylase (regulator of RNase III)
MESVQVGGATLRLVQGDITQAPAEALVTAANSGLRGGGGVDGAIHRAAGPELIGELWGLGECPPGEARITGAGRLPARHIIHAVGPIWDGGDQGEPELLASAYRSALALAEAHGVRTIAFPSISTGAYGYPEPEAARIALRTVLDHLRGGTGLIEVTFVLFTPQTLASYEAALGEVAGPVG